MKTARALACFIVMVNCVAAHGDSWIRPGERVAVLRPTVDSTVDERSDYQRVEQRYDPTPIRTFQQTLIRELSKQGFAAFDAKCKLDELRRTDARVLIDVTDLNAVSKTTKNEHVDAANAGAQSTKPAVNVAVRILDKESRQELASFEIHEPLEHDAWTIGAGVTAAASADPSVILMLPAMNYEKATAAARRGAREAGEKIAAAGRIE